MQKQLKQSTTVVVNSKVKAKIKKITYCNIYIISDGTDGSFLVGLVGTGLDFAELGGDVDLGLGMYF